MAVSRLISLVLLLQTRGRSTATELANRLDVSVRTIYRDLDALSAAGVPVYSERGPQGGCQLLGGYQTRLTGLSGPEAEALFLSTVPGPAGELGRGPVLADAHLKLLSALPEPVRARASAAAQRLHVDLRDWFNSGEATPFLSQVADAVWEGRPIEIHYQRADADVVTRQLNPLGLVVKQGQWYLAAQSGGDHPRVYRLSRITGLRAGEQAFERPANFDLAVFWRAWAAEFEGSRPQYQVTLRATAGGYRAVQGQLAGRLSSRRRVGRSYHLVVDMERPEFAKSQVLGLGPEVEVLAPPELRRRVARSSRAMANIYRSTKLRGRR